MGAVRLIYNLTFQTSKTATYYTDVIFLMEDRRDKLDRRIGMSEHELQLPYLSVRDFGYRLVQSSRSRTMVH